MNCANHPDVAAAAYCRTCGKPLCSTCTRDVRGVTYCESCLAARMEGAVPQQTVYQPGVDQGSGMKVPPAPGPGPNPALAGIFSAFLPGVGAVYCSQYAKGLAHMLIFVLLVIGVNHVHGGLDVFFGFGIAFFYIYQIIDAVKTAHALQQGRPVPDPMGLGQMFSGVQKVETHAIPTGAVVLIGVGILFLLHTMGIFENGFERFWPLLLIVLGGWLLVKQQNRASYLGPIMILTTGVIFLLSANDIADVDRTWPAWILAAGVAQLLRGKRIDPGPELPPTVTPPATGDSTTSSSSEVHHG